MSNHYDGWQAALSTEEEGDRFLQQWLEGEMKCRAGYFVWVRALEILSIWIPLNDTDRCWIA
jgi:hypothetical protein